MKTVCCDYACVKKVSPSKDQKTCKVKIVMSALYYYKHYLHRGPASLTAAGMFLGLVLAEVSFLTGLLKIKAGR